MAGSRKLALAVCAGALSACATVPYRERPAAIERELAASPAVAAWAVAAAVRASLPFADPVPYAGGAPASRLADDRFEVRYEARAEQWLPVASHRLCAAADGRVAVRAAALPGFGAVYDRAFRLSIAARDDGEQPAAAARITGELPAELLPAFDGALARLLSAAAAPDGAAIECRRARDAADSGDVERARHHRDHALLATDDPARRAAIRRTVAIPGTAEELRAEVEHRLARGDLETARALVQTARRSAPASSIDYELIWRLHRRCDDDTGALASALLWREHDRGAGGAVASEELVRGGLSELVARVTRGGDVHVVPAAAPPR